MNPKPKTMRLLLSATAAGLCLSAAAGIDVTPEEPTEYEPWRWTTYLAYSTPTEIAKQNEDSLWVLASGGLYLYEPNNNRITTYSKLKGLSDSNIEHIAWNNVARKLIVTYSNCRIDLVDTQMVDTMLNVTQMNDLYLYSTALDKTINRITTYGQYAYLAVNFGVIKIDVSQAIFLDTYRLNTVVRDVQLTDATGARVSDLDQPATQPAACIWALIAGGKHLKGDLTADLMNPGAWTYQWAPAGTLGQTPASWQQYAPIVKQLTINGPDTNNFYRLRLRGRKLLTVQGGVSPEEGDRRLPGHPQVFNIDTGEWQIYEKDVSSINGNLPYMDILTIDEDPLRPGHVFAGGRNGLYEYQDGQCIAHYDCDNSLLLTALPDTNKHDLTTRRNYTIIEGLVFDRQGTLWITNSLTYSDLGLVSVSQQGEWTQHAGALNLQKNGEYYCHPFIDSRGLMWVNDQFWDDPSTTVVDITSQPHATQTKRLGNRMTNQMRQELTLHYRHCLAEDSAHNVWIGTNGGPVMVEAGHCADATTSVVQPVVGEGIVGQPAYLMHGQPVYAIEVDAEGRLWIASNGLFLIDSDGLTQLEHFTADNSPLLSDAVIDLEYDRTTGVIYIATENGLCSYQTGVRNHDGTDGISLTAASLPQAADAYYTISGLRLPAKPTKPGIYIRRGKKIAIK